MANFKTLQTYISLKSATEMLDLFFHTKGKNKQLLKAILPLGWDISPIEGDYQFVQREVMMSDTDFFQVYTAFNNGQIRILNYFKNEQKEGYLTIRLNVAIDVNDQILVL